MMKEEKTVSYSTSSNYATLNTYSEKTRNIWFVFHGLGHLSRYFLDHFKNLNPEENYIVAPEAPNLYYQDKKYRYVGACWLTREKRDLGIHNNNTYLDAVFEAELNAKLTEGNRLIILGFSQGVSVATRWMYSRKIICHQLILHSGSIPREFEAFAFENLITNALTFLYGTEDSLIDTNRLTEELEYAAKIAGKEPEVVHFKGGHEVNASSILELSRRLI